MNSSRRWKKLRKFDVWEKNLDRERGRKDE